MKLSVFYAEVFLVVVFIIPCLGQDGTVEPKLATSTEPWPSSDFKLPNLLSEKATLRTEGSCPEGYFTIGSSDKCYRVYTDVNRNWTEAKEKCEAEGMQLAEPREIDPVALALYLKESHGLYFWSWLGAKGNGTSLIWQSGEIVSNTTSYFWPGFASHFQNGVPTDVCVGLRSYGSIIPTPGYPYSTYSCEAKYNTLCEQPPVCPSGFFRAGSSQQCFKVYTNVRCTWEEARNLCESEGLIMAHPQDPVALRLHLVENLGVTSYTWLGAQGNGTSHIWQSGEVLSLNSSYWHPGVGQSHMSSTNCLMMDSKKYWADNFPSKPYYSFGCNTNISALCEEIPRCSPGCQNGGICNDAMECVCQPGWMGNQCEIVCGSVNRKMFVVGGNATELHEYPWQVALVWEGSTQVGCGGSLISDRWVLTAAHCTQSRALKQVLLGNHFIQETESAEIRLNIKTFVDHPDYNGGTIDHDFSLLELESPLNLASVAPYIAPVCLPSAENPSQYDDVEAIVSGWGDTSYGGSDSLALLEATVKTMTNVRCNELQPVDGKITDSMICALEVGEGPCHGDSGGPLVTDVDGFYNLIGAVSWTYGKCHSTTIPVQYARVTYVMDWITSTINPTRRSGPQK